MLNQDFKEFVQSLNDNHVRYLDLESAKVQVAGLHAIGGQWTALLS